MSAIAIQRGCPGSCVFCPLRGTLTRYRDFEDLIGESFALAKIVGNQPGGYLSLEVFRDPKPIKEFSDLILRKNIDLSWRVGARCDFINDIGLMKQLKQSGLNSLYFGIECATEETRARVNKPIKDQHIETATEIAEKAGIQIVFSFISGFPWEDEAYQKTMAELLQRLGALPNCEEINLAKLIPYSGLPIENEMISEGILDRRITFQDFNKKNGETYLRYRKTKYLDRDSLDNWFDIFHKTITDQGVARKPI